VEDVNAIVSRIVHLNGKICELRRKQKYGNKSLLRLKQMPINVLNVKAIGMQVINVLIGI